jgi:hypothetical protein
MVVPLFSAKPFTNFHILSRLSCFGSVMRMLLTILRDDK